MSFRLFLTLIFCTRAAWAASLPLSIEGAADYALKHNPTLAAARFRIEEARGRLQQSGRLSNPELELDSTRNLRSREGSIGITLMQRFPVTERLRYEKAVSRAEVAAAEAEVRDVERKLAAEVRAAAVRVLAIEAQRELRSTQLANSRELAGFLVKRVEVGEASVVDASQVELETRQIEIESLQLAAEQVALIGSLRPLLGFSGDGGIKITGALPGTAAPPALKGIANRPDIQAAEYRAEAAAAAVLQQRSNRWQDIGVGASYSLERSKDEPDPIETEQIAGLKISIPLPVWNDNAGRIREAEAAAARAAKEAGATKLTARSEENSARSEMAALAKLIGELDSAVLPKAEQIEELLRSNYAAGLTPLPEVLRARTRRLELQRLRLDALRDYQLARIRQNAAVLNSSK
ncbi:MAG: hypothetical protein JWL59_1814 [Chthoniobacteraceae bacterium]|nr:hypothetical protein [Chthoniobacteraceae bacterium]